MIPASPSSPGGSPPSSSPRVDIDQMSADSAEYDLWALDDLDDLENDSVSIAPTARETAIPAPRALDTPAQKAKAGGAAMPVVSDDAIALKLKKSSSTIKPSGTPSGRNVTTRESDDLPEWEDLAKSDKPEISAESVDPSWIEALEKKALGPKKTDAAAAAKPSALRLNLNLSKLEKIGLFALLGLLLVGGGIGGAILLKGLPREAERAMANDFPIPGKHLEITAAETYWRAPIDEGKTRDLYRRGTILLPVVQLSIGPKTGGVRVVFRNSQGERVGDVVTRSAVSAQKLEIAATAGFETEGMHAAYRTGGDKPWIAEVFEAASANAAAGDFKKLFEMEISSSLH